MRAIGYRRVSTGEQAESGLGLEAQRVTIEQAVAGRGSIVSWHTDAGISGKTMDRPGLSAALAELDAGTADALVVAKLDRLGRSTIGVLGLVEHLEQRGYGLVVADLALDTTTPVGQFTLSIMAAFGQLERRMISDRTKAALAAARARGVVVGRPRQVSRDTVGRALELRDTGLSYAKVAEALELEGHQTAAGGRWGASSVRWLIVGRSEGSVARHDQEDEHEQHHDDDGQHVSPHADSMPEMFARQP